MAGAASEAMIVSILIRAIDGASSIFRSIGLTGIASMGGLTGAAALVAAGIGAIGVVSIRTATSFDQSIHKVAALSDMFQQSGYTMQWYENQLLALAPQIDVAPTKLADALYFVASAGFRGQQAIDILKYSAEAAAASMGDMKSVADLVTSAMQAYSKQGLSAGHATDVIMQAVVQGKVEMHALETSFSFVATTGLSAKFSIEEVAAAVSTLTRVSGNSAARRVQMDLDNLIRRLGDVGGVAKSAHDLGLAFNETKFASSSFIDRLIMLMNMSGFTADTLADLRKQAGGNEQVFEQLALKAANSSTAFKKLAGGAAAMIPAVILMKDNGATFNDILSKMTGNGEQTAEAFKKMRESTGQQWNMFKVTLESIATLIGLRILPSVNSLLGAFIGAGRGLIAFLEDANKLDALKWALLGIGIVVLSVLTPAIVGAVVAAAPFLLTVAAIIAGGMLLGNIIHALVDHFGGWHAIMQKLQPIITIVQDAVSGLAKDIQKGLASPEMQEAIKQFKQALPELLPLLKIWAIFMGVQLVIAFELFRVVILAVVAILPKLIEVGTAVIHLLGYIFSGKIFQDLGNALGAIKAKIGDFFNALGTKVHDGLAAIGQFFSDRWDDIRNGVGGFFNGLGTDVHNGIENVKNQFLSSIHHIGDAFGWLYNHNYYWQGIVDFIRAKIEWLKGIIHTVLTAIQAAWTATLQRIQSFVSQQWKRITDFLGERVEAAKTAIHNALTLIEQRWEAFKAAVSATVQTMGTWLYDHLIKPIGDFLGYIGGIKDKIGTFFHDNVIKPITDLVGNLITAAEDWGKNLIDHFINGLKGKAGDLKNAAGGVFQNIAGWFGFHSPAPFVPESAYWGPNLIKMFASGMLANAHLVGNAAQGVIGQAGAGLTGGASGAGGGGLPLVGAGAGGGGGTTTINVYFPNATSRDEITAAIRQVQQGDYRAGRRAGGYGGLRAGISPQ